MKHLLTTLFVAFGIQMYAQTPTLDSAQLRAFYHQLDSISQLGQDSSSNIKDSSRYSIQYICQGGYTSRRLHKFVQISSLSRGKSDTLLAKSNLSIAHNNELFVPNYVSFDSLSLEYPRGLSITQRRIWHVLSRNKIIQNASMSQVQPPESFRASLWTSTYRFSYAKAKYLVVIQPQILQQGGETDWGSHQTWILKRVD